MNEMKKLFSIRIAKETAKESLQQMIKSPILKEIR